MSKSLFFTILGLGRVPKSVLSVLKSEEIQMMDEGMKVSLITKNVKGPGKRYINRSEGGAGSLVVTKKRVSCYTFSKRQINIAVDDPKIRELFVKVISPDKISIKFESSVFREGWSGKMEFLFTTDKAQEFYNCLTSIGMKSSSDE